MTTKETPIEIMERLTREFNAMGPLQKALWLKGIATPAPDAKDAQGEPIYAYEWDCGPGVVHRDFQYCSYNGRRPDRTLTLYRALPRASDAQALTVWYGSMPESNGKTNWTAILHRGDVTRGITLAMSEYPDRVRYEADRMRWMIGQLADEPFILDYDADKHSGYVAPATAPLGFRHCQSGNKDVCRAGQRDGVACPEDSCDIDDGIRKADASAIAERTIKK